MPVPKIRIADCNAAPIRADGDYVLYWMIAFRRLRSNFSLQRAVEWAVELKKPLVIFEPLRIGYRWASDRIHRFVIDGMADNAARAFDFADRGVYHYSYVEPRPDADKGLLAAWAERAAVIVTDEFPSFFLPRMVAAAARALPVKLEQVDSNGLLPLRATDRVFTTAHSFRRFLQHQLQDHLADFPKDDPLARVRLPTLECLPPTISKRWPSMSHKLPADNLSALKQLPIDHEVETVDYRGGSKAARRELDAFLQYDLSAYALNANHPDDGIRSGLSPYLHFGHISPHEMFDRLMRHVGWTPDRIAKKPTGSREGWWGAVPEAEAWLDQFITWRELGYNLTSKTDDYDRYESLPTWARATLEKHAQDKRPTIYTLAEFTAAQTHDPLWNAAQTQLVREGRMHNYLRMLWGKKILEWSATPRDALDTMIELNNRFALDGRNPNSYSGIFWCLGRYDRPWGPERPIYGTVRYMSSDNTAKKLRVREYLRRYGNGASHGA